MRYLLDLLESYTEQKPGAPILFDDAHSRGVTYRQLDEMSGRIYAYLKNHGVGREDFVLIDLPRGVMPVIAMIGVWKAGAAWALVEDTYAPDRIAYIREDCGCSIELNAKNWDEVMNTEPLTGHETVDDHDAAYAIYTSGTTGNPKGVLHEYGNLNMAIESLQIDGKTPFDDKDRLALLAPLNFVASVIVIVEALSIFCGKSFVVGYATIKNPGALKKFFLEKRITITFLTPSYVRMLGNQTGPFLRMLFVGSEPANNIYNKKLDLINIYSSSETGFAVGVFKIDRPYETCPIGRPVIDAKIRLVGENGEDVEDGEIGELWVADPYARGYLNLPEETEKAFLDGYFHTGDLARKEPDGNYVLLGRSGDMIKINGNRIEPAEIEAAVKQVLGIKWAAARGFEDKGKSYLCAYYTDNITVDPGKMREELARRLPYYMIPSYYVKIDEVPLKANGKMDRSALPEPDAADFVNEYAAPTNETEEKLCHAMEKVLELQQVGIHDDFYELGGDSLGSIKMITESELPGLTASEIFRGRTPEKIAEIYLTEFKNDGESPEIRDRAAREREFPLTAEQLYMVDYQLYAPVSTMYNLFTMMKFDKDAFDMERLADAMHTAIRNHPALLTTFHFNRDGDVIQRYTPGNLRDLHVEKISEFEFENIKDNLVQPFKIIDGPLYRCRIFETEKNGYIFFDVHHTVFDGTSLKVFMGNVGKAYMGMVPDPDYYYLMLQNRADMEQTGFYEESRKYFEDHYEGVKWSSYPETDHESREDELGEFFANLGIEQAQMSAMERQYKISRNEFFITTAILAISVYNRKNDVRICWIYNGREDMQLLSTVGLLFRDLPVGVHLRDDMTLRELFAEVHEQVQGGIEHSCYPYVDKDSQVMIDESAYVLYQQDMRDLNGLDDMEVETVDIRQNQAASQTYLDMEILDGADGLVLMIDYAASLYNDESMEKYKDLYIRIAHALVTHNSQQDVTVGEIKAKVSDRKNFFESIMGIFRRKK